MLANLFRKTKIISLLLGGVLCFICLVFYHNTTEDLFQDPLQILTNSALKTLIISVGLSLLFLVEKKHRNLKISALHCLSMLIVVLYLPQGSLSFKGLLLQFFLIIALHNVSLIYTAKNVARACFNLSLIFSCLILFESIFVWFLIIPATFFLDQRTRNLKYVIAYLIPPLLILVWTLTTIHFFDLDYSFMESRSSIFIGIKELTYNEYLFILLMSIVVLFPIMSNVRRGIVANVGVHIFLFIWFFVGLYTSFFRSNNVLNPWELTFFPLLHLLGIFLGEVSHRKTEALIFFLIILKGSILYFMY